MPSSDPENINLIVKLAKKIAPKHVLDIGIGTGKYGLLFRDYLDGHAHGHAFHDPDTWTMTMVGVEVFKDYITPVHEYLYDEIIIDDAYHYFLNMNHLGHFDLIFMGDVIEHWDKEKGLELIECFRVKWLRAGGHLLISTPNFTTRMHCPAQAVFGNQHEIHKCRWHPKDFENLKGFDANIFEGRLLTVDLTKKG